jgi:TonB family protein
LIPRYHLARCRAIVVALVVLGGGLEAAAATQYCATLLPLPNERIGGRILPIVEVRGEVPYVEFKGKLVPADPATIQQYLSEIMLSDATNAPGWIRASKPKVEHSGTRFVNTPGGPFNKEFLFSVELESPVALDQCWIALSIASERGGSGNLLQEIGSLQPYTPRTITIRRQLAVELGEGKYSWHVFSHDREILHTQMKRAYVDDELRSNAARVRSRGREAEAEPYLTFPPAGEFKPGTRVTLTLKVNEDGEVRKATVIDGTGAAAEEKLLGVARQWWFLPKMVHGQAVPAIVTVAIDLGTGAPWSKAAVQRVAAAAK